MMKLTRGSLHDDMVSTFTRYGLGMSLNLMNVSTPACLRLKSVSEVQFLIYPR
jgi:hypothetical protein